MAALAFASLGLVLGTPRLAMILGLLVLMVAVAVALVERRQRGGDGASDQ